MPIAKVGDIRIHYLIEGQGPPLLMIMGFGASSVAWSDEYTARFTPSFRTIRFDNRGTGLSDKPDGEYSIRMMAEDAAGLLRALGIEKAHVFGVSMGGMIAQELVLNHPQLVQGLVLGCTTPGWNKGEAPAQEVIDLMIPQPNMSPADQIRRGWPAVFRPSFIDSQRDFLESQLRKSLEHPTPIYAMMRQAAAIQAFEAYDRLNQIRAPTLIIHGDQDVLVPTANAYILAERIPNAELQIIEGAAHGFIWEEMDGSARLIIDFLSRVAVEA